MSPNAWERRDFIKTLLAGMPLVAWDWSIFPRGDNQYRIRFLDPVCPAPEDDADSMSDRVYRCMVGELKPLDTGTIWDTEQPARHD